MSDISITSKPFYKRTVQRLLQYQSLRDRATFLAKELEFSGPKTTAAYSLAPGGSGPGDPAGQLAETLMDKKAELAEKEKEIRLIDTAVGMLSEEKQLIVKLRYLEENSDKYAFWVLRKNHGIKSRVTYYKLKDEAVAELAKTFGEVGVTENEPEDHKLCNTQE